MKRSEPLPDSTPRDSRGEWRPEEPAGFVPLLTLPVRLKAMMGWLFGYGGYLWPTNMFFLLVSVVAWFYTQPPIEACTEFRWDWMSQVFLRNQALIWFYYGGLHLYLYVLKREGTRKKYNRKWPDEQSKRFLFRNQVWDNIFWTAGSAGLIWTLYEWVFVWLYANNLIPWLTWADSPVLFLLWFFVIPLWREFHFYWVHRLTHWKPLYRYVHYLHHKNVNPNPWSGLAMHPVETTLYFSDVLIHLIVPSHPIHFLFALQYNGMAPAHGHSGFDGPIAEGTVTADSYFHYLHHKHFECNYGGSIIPLDKWFGSFRDGQPKGVGAALPEEQRD